MAKTFTTKEYILIDRKTGKPYRTEDGFTLVAPTRKLAREDKKIAEYGIFGTGPKSVRIARVNSRYTVDQFIR